MDEQQLFDRALESLDKLLPFKAATEMKASCAERLEAIAAITATLPWKDVATLSIGWEIKRLNADDQIFPTLNIVMKDYDIPPESEHI